MATYGNCLFFNAPYWQYLINQLLIKDQDIISKFPHTLPVSDISPVIAMFCLTGLPRANDSIADTIVQPAEGPSLGTAPYYRLLVLNEY